MGSILEAVGLQLIMAPASSALVCRTACAVVGVLYPAYQSFKAIEAPLSQHEERDKQWLTYWSIHGSLSLAERLFHNQVDGLPVYYHFKLAFLLWLQLPSFQGAQRLYGDYLQPFLMTHQHQVDHFLHQLKSSDQPELAAFFHRLRVAAKKIPVLGYFAQYPDE